MVDFLISAGLKKAFYKVKSGSIYISNYAFNKCKDDILFFGASEVTHHFNSNAIADSTGLSCYNLGMDGYGINYQFPLLQTILKRHTPKIIIISTSQLSGKKIESSELYPYYSVSSNVKKVVDTFDVYDKYKLLIKSYAYNSMIAGIVEGMLSNESSLHGYIPLQGKSRVLTLNAAPEGLLATPKSIFYFDNFLKSAKASGALVYVIASPRYQINNKKEDSVLISAICQKNAVKFLDYLSDTSFINHPELFKDNPHLNYKGAAVLTNKVIAVISKDYKGR